MNDSSGWVKLHRSILTWEWFTDVNTAHFFEYCIVKANHDDDTWRGIRIKRGSFLSSYETMHVESGLTVQKIRTAIEKLKSTGEITSEATNNYTIITVCNYDNYQIEAKQEQQTIQQAEQQAEQQTIQHAEQHATQQQTRNKEEKNKEDKKEDANASSKKEKFDFLSALISIGIDEQVAKDWMKIRAAKKASDSSTAFKQLHNALQKIQSIYKITYTDAIIICVTNGWYGCKESYFTNIRLSDFVIKTEQPTLFGTPSNSPTKWE